MYPLDTLLKKHLFLIAPNNSGSTFFQNILKTSLYTWNLQREGQWIQGYSGPNTTDVGLPLLWAAQQESVATFIDAANYNWEVTKKAWYFQAFSQTADAPVFTTKAPPFLLITDMLKKHFHNTRFIFMVRNPYAVVEGISRRKEKNVSGGEDIFILAAQHIMRCFAYQKSNLERYAQDSLFFTYEEMCASPALIEEKIKVYIPELKDIQLCQKIAVKGIYNEMLRNMNDEQIARLPQEALGKINSIFKEYEDLMNYFGYEFIEKAYE
jgi:hypothetical protein